MSDHSDGLVYDCIQQNEPISFGELRIELDVASRDLVKILGRLFEQGEIFEPQPNQFRIVPE